MAHGAARVDIGVLIRLLSIFLALASGWLPVAGANAQAGAAPAPTPSQLLDRRVATLGHRLAVANLAWCSAREWRHGIVLIELSQVADGFRPVATRLFGRDSGLGIMALAADAPGEQAGLRAGDVIVTLDGRAVPPPASGEAPMAPIMAAIDAAFADGRAEIEVARGEARAAFAVQARQGCATTFRAVPRRSVNASANGSIVSVNAGLLDFAPDDAELAAAMAHEFAHNLLRHAERLDAAGVRRGLLGNFGRNARLIRETEEEADRLSVWLLANAGFDPNAAARFWARLARSGLNFLGSPTHGLGGGTRVRRIEAEIAAMRAAGPGARPPLLPR